MSSSALIAAKKRLETSLKKFEIPTTETVNSTTTTTESCKSGVLLLSLLQSRLNWTSSIFARYKADPVQQPKRTSNSRKKWPNMKYLGTGIVELGPHLFEQTTFYEATRSIPWKNIAKEQGLIVPEEEDTVMTEASEEQNQEGLKEKEEPQAQEAEQLKFVDIVFELNELPNERFVFPKEALISLSVEDGPIVVHASFLLPIDVTDYFFEPAKDQILIFGKSCQLPYIQDFIQSTAKEERSKIKPQISTTISHPTNVRITEVNQTTIDALEDAVNNPEEVKKIMSIKMKSSSVKKAFVKNDLSEDPTINAEVQDLLERSLTVPEIATGPIMAEKKRKEIINAIKLGKRPRDEKFEADLPKNKYVNNNAKDDGLLKCAYCSTKHTAMWRPGPSGQGTLCNSCGIQWKRGEILKGAPVIDLQEERRLLKEKKEREKIAEALELEKMDRENKKGQKKTVERQQSVQDGVDVSNKKFAAQLLSQRAKKNKPTLTAANIPSVDPTIKETLASSTPEPTLEPLTETTSSTEKKKSTAKINKAKPAAPVDNATTAQASEAVTAQGVAHAANPPLQTQPQQQQSSATQQQQQSQQSFLLYSQGGIPLPTLFIDFAGPLKFSHPNCAVTLLDGHFHIRLCSAETGEQCLINLEKSDLAEARFEISQEGEPSAIRELLTMTIPPLSKPLEIFSKSLASSPSITIRFLEKLDPTGGAVVKRILQRWLVTVPQTPQPQQAQQSSS